MLLLPTIIIRPDEQTVNRRCMTPNAAIQTRPDGDPKDRKDVDCGLNCRLR
ncbi:hypothetical protein QBC32DRAFT_201239 [Pseudoneurospora amorphoporcata]|uniref:Uncharacterized protein n=1 Tax=Pseudoneurospora amorphoporcata TaxID=241081 RepID=A0AAN6SL07_9PEZI|nr:hypothetical protein QBC32DRAFT_201239 [Pseudoneurospora amorphoporcata]